MTATFSRDSKGIAQILKSPEVAAAVGQLADQVARNVQARAGTGAVVDVNEYTTDRAAASVLLVGGDAAARQAKEGVLTRAAADAGLEVTSR